MAERRAEAILLVALLLLGCSGHLVPVTEAVWLTIPSSGTKCVSEEIQSNVVVLADYYIVDEEHAHLHTATISSRVTSPYGNNLHHNENVTHGQFAFTTSEAGNYLACFWIGGKHQEAAGLTIGLDWKIGIAAKDWESVAKREKIQGMELELLKLEGAVQAIHDNLIYLKNSVGTGHIGFSLWHHWLGHLKVSNIPHRGASIIMSIGGTPKSHES
ncbi:transmembrane emp24 domain-containing protein p24delta5-like isoform X3 [Rhodamnia argentea]|uniref:Transmembrane emp24 domain-containing protein p24delta5-like isoform X3 n=1 Tax=Rhodamnia argentea TaxID=178133 RepID=A0ABM3GZY4_9MYRT|nr:transmembrane emp24 domain-containing protein p24delta5-like isoform X3 [Rhodamnia argentea]